MGFYDNLTRLSRAKGMKVTQAIVAAGCDRSGVTYWRHGRKPTYATLQKLADFFGVTVETLTAEERFDISHEADLTTAEERELLAAWRAATFEQRENIAFILRQYGFTYERPAEKKKIV